MPTTETPTPEQRRELLELAFQSVPLPWAHIKYFASELVCWIVAPSDTSHYPEGYPLAKFNGPDATADYLVAACNLAPGLVREVERLQTDASTVAHLRSVSKCIAEGKTAGAHLSDAEVAGRVRMMTRSDLDHEAVCVMGRDRIIALSNEVERLQKGIEAAPHGWDCARNLELQNACNCWKAALAAGKETK